MKPPLLTREDALTAILVFVMGVGICVPFVGLKWPCFAIPLGLATAFLCLHIVHGLKKRSRTVIEAAVSEKFAKVCREHAQKVDETSSLDEFRRRRTRAADHHDDDDPNGKSAA